MAEVLVKASFFRYDVSMLVDGVLEERQKGFFKLTEGTKLSLTGGGFKAFVTFGAEDAGDWFAMCRWT